MTSYSAKTIEEILEQAAEEKGCSVEDLWRAVAINYWNLRRKRWCIRYW